MRHYPCRTENGLILLNAAVELSADPLFSRTRQATLA